MATKKKARRTVMYSSGGKKLYAVRDKTGKFKDIQQYSRAHRMDMARKSKDEVAGASPVKKAAKKAAKKVAAKKTAARKTVKKAASKVRTAVRRVVKAAKKAAKKK
ncbi:MAG: hypothetical protein MUF79_09855 [Burkholderiales bacterium]|jgi:hypothetical protein|nr:hypothetical protein [Burkholderiales bacterium]